MVCGVTNGAAAPLHASGEEEDDTVCCALPSFLREGAVQCTTNCRTVFSLLTIGSFLDGKELIPHARADCPKKMLSRIRHPMSPKFSTPIIESCFRFIKIIDL
eukprot:COSAG01_NODE_15442_length_1337_cov_1.273021_2_plen_103_part_00